MNKYNLSKNFLYELNRDRDIKKDDVSPKISIVMPSYNQAQFIEWSILSILNQDYSNTEFIIIDGGSTDGTIDLIKKYEREITLWISEKDQGQSDALNKGFKYCTGEIYGWLNSDDIYLPDAFKNAASTTFLALSTKSIGLEDRWLKPKLTFWLKENSQPSLIWKLYVSEKFSKYLT